MKKLGLAHKMMLVVCLPLLALLFFSGRYVYERYRVEQEMSGALVALAVVKEAAQLAHELQRERGMSAGFLGSGGNKFRDALPAQRKVVDSLLQRFHQDPALLALTEVQQEWPGLTAMRERVSALGVEVAEQVGFYTRLVTALLAVVDKISVDSMDATIALQTNAYAAFLQSKERAGRSGRRSATSLAVTASRLRCCSSSSPCWRPRTPISNVSRRWRVQPSASCWPTARLARGEQGGRHGEVGAGQGAAAARGGCRGLVCLEYRQDQACSRR
jgi:hypothetical protein